MKGFLTLLFLMSLYFQSMAAYILIPMDESQKNHLKAYGIAYWCLEREVEVDWLLNYRGGSFMMQAAKAIQSRCC